MFKYVMLVQLPLNISRKSAFILLSAVVAASLALAFFAYPASKPCIDLTPHPPPGPGVASVVHCDRATDLWHIGKPYNPKGFTKAELLYNTWGDCCVYHFTMLNGTSADFGLQINATTACIQFESCNSDYPLKLELYFKARELKGIRIVNSSKYRQLAGEEYLPNSRTPIDLKDVCFALSPNPLILGQNGRVNATVTLTTMNNASDGVYAIGLGGRSNNGLGALEWTYFYLTIENGKHPPSMIGVDK